MTFALLPAAVTPAAAEPEAIKTSNIGHNNYLGNYARDDRSFLYENAQGGLTRVECYTEGETDRITVETYDKDFRLLASKQIGFPAGFTIWGGAFHGEQYNYLMVGSDDSKTENKSAEVIRVIQYDQDWNELGGMADAGDAYVVAYKNVTTRYDKRIRGDYQNLYMVRIPKDNLTEDGIQTIKLTDETLRIDALNSRLKEDGDLFCSTPVLVPTSTNTGYLMWTNLRYTTLESKGSFASFRFYESRLTDQLFILPYDATTVETFAASMAKKPMELKDSLSDCQPFVYNGKLVWYTTGQFESRTSTASTRSGHESTPVFYVFDCQRQAENVDFRRNGMSFFGGQHSGVYSRYTPHHLPA